MPADLSGVAILKIDGKEIIINPQEGAEVPTKCLTSQTLKLSFW